jgi:hypothetical protein
MSDDDRKTAFTRKESDLTQPTFDDHASANARPVMPIRKNGLTKMKEWFAGSLAAGTKSLVLVIALGLAAGTLAGLALVRQRETNPLVDKEHVSSVPQTSTTDLPIISTGAYGLQTAEQSFQRVRRFRPRVQASSRPRAYRVAVIR